MISTNYQQRYVDMDKLQLLLDELEKDGIHMEDKGEYYIGSCPFHD